MRLQGLLFGSEGRRCRGVSIPGACSWGGAPGHGQSPSPPVSPHARKPGRRLRGASPGTAPPRPRPAPSSSSLGARWPSSGPRWATCTRSSRCVGRCCRVCACLPRRCSCRDGGRRPVCRKGAPPGLERRACHDPARARPGESSDGALLDTGWSLRRLNQHVTELSNGDSSQDTFPRPPSSPPNPSW